MQSRRRQRVLGTLVGVAMIVLAACSPASAPRAEVPLQSGNQTTLPFEASGYSDLAFDARNVMYLGGAMGISTAAPGAVKPTPLNLKGHPIVMTFAVAPDGTLSFVAMDGVVASAKPGAAAPEPLPFEQLRRYSSIAVAQDGTVYLGDNQHDKLLKLPPGAAAPTALPAEVNELGHMVIDGADNIYASMAGKVVKIAKDATTAEPVAGLSDHVGGIAVDAAGNLYATDNQANTVSRMPAGGGDWVELPFTGLHRPTAVAVDGDGNVYVVHQITQIARLAAK